ncbi:universal stress protein [Algoriphagus boritolerans]|uniref:Nucleotide-binding universal stress protein, UspA family n=1 Tax=Algoriphagus boritolerans DSM 17298 = JCM 18970 TaxID=1120964 RepID=A0A1H5Y0N5_9BACT|nr:universal stress protein [Algoriphagus boritolerans]SEG17564.1 Nucleotide-binding universal stress protein, UspA family [Algoriphagus boritolerans DSM 17298 = JCM 18970]
MMKVLVPYDFSQTADYALNFATGLSENYSGIEITVLHIIETPVATGMGTMGGGLDSVPEFENQIYFIELIERRKKQLKEIDEKFKDSAVTLKTKLVLGSVFKGITESIAEQSPDLIVMGSKGASGLEEVIVGSNTEKVVRTATCPVVTIKAETDVKKMKKIVFASDFRESDEKVANRIKRIQTVFDAQFYFVVVNTPGNFETTRESMNRIRTFVQKHHFENIKAEVYNSLSEESGIIEFADDIDADLIAMTTHGRTGLIHLITGSIAEDVVNHSKRPVWTYRVK